MRKIIKKPHKKRERGPIYDGNTWSNRATASGKATWNIRDFSCERKGEDQRVCEKENRERERLNSDRGRPSSLQTKAGQEGP